MLDYRIIVLGDLTSHGGEVVSAWGAGRYTIDGIPVACVGDKVTCPKKGHNNCCIVQGDPNSTLDGKPIAYEGCKVSCGATLVSKGQSHSTLSVDYGGASAVQSAASTYAAATTSGASTGAAARGIQTASATPGITPEEARMLAEQKKEEEEKKGFVAVFVNNNGKLTGEHASVFVGDINDKNRILFDPCGSYDKGKREGTLGSRGGDVLGAEQFDYNGYYNYHREDGSDIRVFGFRITKEEENKIRARISDPEFLHSCDMDCTVRTREVLRGIGPFKNLKPSGILMRRTPKSITKDMEAIKGGKL